MFFVHIPKKLDAKRPQPELLLDACRGIYIPRDFVACGWGVVPHDEKILLAGPEHKAYWDAWDAVLEEAEYVDENGTHWSLYHDGDLWAVPHGMVWDEATEWFVWPEDDDDETTSAIDRLSTADASDARRTLGLGE